jgi:hypothetical protein
MILLGSLVQVKGFGLALVSSRKRYASPTYLRVFSSLRGRNRPIVRFAMRLTDRTANREAISSIARILEVSARSPAISNANCAFSPDNRAFSPDHRAFSPDNRAFSPDHRAFSPDNRAFSLDNCSTSACDTARAAMTACCSSVA